MLVQTENNRSFYAACITGFLLRTEWGIATTFLPLQVYELGGSPLEVSLVFSVFAAIIQRAGLSLYHALSRVALPGYSHVFGQMSREGELVTRDVKFLGSGVAETFERRAETHPSDRYANFLLSYTSVWRSGGDLAAALEDRVEERCLRRP